MFVAELSTGDLFVAELYKAILLGDLSTGFLVSN